MLRARQQTSPRGLLACSLALPCVVCGLTCVTAAEPRCRPTPDGRRGGDAEVTKCRLEPAGSSGAEEPSSFGLRKAHAVVHQFERRLRRAPRFLRTEREEPLQLALICTKRFEALAD